MAVILGAANAYLGLKAGMTVAATFPAAVVSMAVLRIFGGSILEENMARTIASVGEALVAGAIFTIPAFYIAGVWKKFGTWENYLESTAIMMVGGVIGVLFVTILRRIMVAESDLPFPESIAAAEIHKAGRTGGTGAQYLFGAMAVGGLIQLAAKLKLFASSWEKFVPFGKSVVRFVTKQREEVITLHGQGGMLLATPAVSPAYVGVGFIIGPKLSCIAFSGGVLAWALFVPLMMFFMGPAYLEQLVGKHIGETVVEWSTLTVYVWKYIVRPIAVGGMIVGAFYTLYKMREQLFGGIARAIGDIKKAAGQEEQSANRLDKDLNFKWIFIFVGIGLIFMAALYWYFCRQLGGALISTLVMAVAGFFFAAVAGYLVGLIGSSNNPISGLTLSTLIIAALLMVGIGVQGTSGIAAVLGVAAVVCCMCGVAGDMLQDLKVGHILGGTPWKMELGEIIGVIAAALVMFVPLMILHEGNIKMGGTGFGDKAIPAPQAGLMAMLAEGIVGGEMAWPLVIVGMFMAVGLVMVGSPSPMLIAVGMYLPLETTFTIFIGGMIRWVLDTLVAKKGMDEEKKAGVENTGVLLASGFIAGEALMGLIIAALAFANIQIPAILKSPSIWVGMGVLTAYAVAMVLIPLRSAKEQEQPA